MRIFRISTPARGLSSQAAESTYNQYLLVDDEPLLFSHRKFRCSRRSQEAVARILRWNASFAGFLFAFGGRSSVRAFK